MKCLTPEKALSGQCGFMAANLYARSIFGEDALANLSIEKGIDKPQVSGHIRIRAKSQVITKKKLSFKILILVILRTVRFSN